MSSRSLMKMIRSLRRTINLSHLAPSDSGHLHKVHIRCPCQHPGISRELVPLFPASCGGTSCVLHIFGMSLSRKGLSLPQSTIDQCPVMGVSHELAMIAGCPPLP